ncbi:MAG: FkbM family methyltransferase, partial [Pseudomonadota bacterium]|nr:FkbM family methyltransferase [Pseudomonadota bacterium]
MITVDEASHHFEPARPPAIPKRDSYGLDGLDRKILDTLPKEAGFFIELGAYDGIDQNNSLILEQAGWRGLLVEPIPAHFAQCLRNRPAALVEHAACVGADYNGDTITLADVGLMSLTGRAGSDQDAINAHLAAGEKHAGRRRQLLEVPARQLSQILDKHKVAAVDLLILDVEGAEWD